MTTGDLLVKSLEFQADTELSLNEIRSYISHSEAQERFDKLIKSMPDKRLAMDLEAAAIDMILDAIQKVSPQLHEHIYSC